ncbi:hypothetical protein L0128_06435 [candidate division KSB1 bacterium]|nr:hypothetical protein [candidate division KSB1 bacterium]
MKKQFDSKTRVLTAFAHQIPDRVPLDYLANFGIDQRLKAHFGLASTDDEGLRQRLGIDFRTVDPPYIGPPLHPPQPDRHINIWGIRTRWIEHPAGGYWDYCDFPLQNATVAEVDAWPMPNPDHFDYDDVVRECRRFQNYGVIAGNPGLGDIINCTSMLRTMEQVLIDLMVDDPACYRLIERRIQVQLAILERTLEAAQGAIDILWIGEDLGTQIGPMISLELFRKHIRPWHQKFIDLAKVFGIPVMLHSCGSSSWAFDDFIEMGVTIVDTLQPEAQNMAPAYLKNRFGDRLSFHGCISTAGTIVTGSVTDTRETVRQTLEIMMPGGGFALAPTHLLQDNTPVENVAAMYQTAQDLGQY